MRAFSITLYNNLYGEIENDRGNSVTKERGRIDDGFY